MGHITQEKRWEIVSTWKRVGTIAGTARECHVKESTAARWIGRYKLTRLVEPRKSSGRKRILDSAGDAVAEDLLLRGEYGCAAGVAQELHNRGITKIKVSNNTVISAAKRAANAKGKPIMAYRGKPAKRLTAASKSKRLQFAKANKNRNWNQVMFSDRKKFNFSYPGAKVKPCTWLRKGEKLRAAAVNHAQTFNIYVGITKHGATSCHVVAGTSNHKTAYKNKKGATAKNITSEEYTAVLDTTLLPEGKRMFTGQGVSTWTLQQDNDPAHKEAQATISSWNHNHSSSILLLPSWPPNSPDLNPMENVWAWAEAKVNALGCKTMEQFKQAVVKTIQTLPKPMITNLYKSMPNRMAEVIRLDGDMTKY